MTQYIIFHQGTHLRVKHVICDSKEEAQAKVDTLSKDFKYYVEEVQTFYQVLYLDCSEAVNDEIYTTREKAYERIATMNTQWKYYVFPITVED